MLMIATCALALTCGAGGAATAQQGLDGFLIIQPIQDPDQPAAQDSENEMEEQGGMQGGTTGQGGMMGQGTMGQGGTTGQGETMGQGRMMGPREAMEHGGMMGRRRVPLVMMRIMFALMDTDGNGTVELNEFQAAHERIFKAMDANKDGKLTFDEMRAFMTGRSVGQQQKP
jgi:hypothetical protein